MQSMVYSFRARGWTGAGWVHGLELHFVRVGRLLAPDGPCVDG